MKIVFFGTPEFGAIILEKLSQTPFKPILVVTSPDKPKGRKQILTPPPVKVVAQNHNISVLQSKKVINIGYRITKIKPDLIIVAAFGQILPKELLKIPKYGSLNVHPSLLPKYRGSSPIRYAILEGEEKTGVTIILMDEKMDHGPIIAMSSVKCQMSNVTYEELSRKLADLGAKLLIETIPKWVAGEITPKPQDESKATYTKIIEREDGKIDWQKNTEELERKIRAFHPWPGTFCFWEKKRIKILQGEVLKQTKVGPFGIPGKTFLAPDNKISVQAGEDFLIITELQMEGKKPISSEEFLRGHPDFVGTVLK